MVCFQLPQLFRAVWCSSFVAQQHTEEAGMVRSVLKKAELISSPWPLFSNYIFYTFLCSEIINLGLIVSNLRVVWCRAVKEKY